MEARSMRQQRNVPTIDLPGEQWRAIDYTQGLYFVSDKGRIKKKWINKRGQEIDILMNPFCLPVTGKQLIGLQVKNGRVFRYVHELVLLAFQKKPKQKNMIP